MCSRARHGGKKITADAADETRIRDPDPYTDDDVGDDVPQRATTACIKRPTDAEWICFYGSPRDPHAKWLCAACAATRACEPIFRPLDAIDLGRPHVWSIERVDGCIQDLVYAESLADADFVVPPAAVHLLDPHALDAMMRWAKDEPEVRFCEITPTDIGSVRGWMPLAGSHVVHRTEGSWYVERKRRRVPLVCCDRRNPIWGAVVLVDFNRSTFSMTWHGIEDDLAALLARWRRHRGASFSGHDWVTWAGSVYIDTVERYADAKHKSDEKKFEEQLQTLLAIMRGDRAAPESA